jgi:hypothetical protein
MRPRSLQAAAAAVIFVLCLGSYLLTLAPTITWQHDGVDSGDLVAAAHTLGVAHPPGYPLFLLLARVFILLPVGEIAYRVNLLSAVCAAVAAVLVYCIALLLVGRRIGTLSAISIAAASALLFGFSYAFWSQAVIAEVYTLNALLIAASILLAVLHRRTNDRRFLWALGLTLGLGLANHLSALLFVPATMFLALDARPARRSTWLGALGFFALGLSLYLYLPACSARHPPIDWGGSRTWAGFWWMVSARIYRDYAFAVPLAHLPGRVIAWLRMLTQQFTWAGFALGLVGVWELWEDDRRFVAFSLASFGPVVVYSLTYNTSDSYVYLIPSFLLFTLWVARGAADLSVVASRFGPIRKRDGLLSPSHVQRFVSVALLALPFLLLRFNASRANLRNDWTAHQYAIRVLATTPSDAIIIADTDAHIFSLWYARYVVGSDAAPTIVAKGLFHYQWYKDTLRWNEPDIVMTSPLGDPHAQLAAFIEANLPDRAIYLTERDERILSQYPYSWQHGLYKLGVKG